GRAIVGNAGVLLTKVEYLKHNADRNFAIVDAAMNDLMRPALYNAWHAITPVTLRTSKPQAYDIVGPVCETGDWLGKNRPLSLAEGDILAVENVGAYGFTMSSNYNTRPRCAEILIDGDKTHIIRERENLDDLLSGEHIFTG
ncbi:MAG: diaminopimelate decarboxylase, partial [Gammaproteobacteria bacterium]|nr:diaminopimelate decarboxylase [Gammaproteobacteria bacterium]